MTDIFNNEETEGTTKPEVENNDNNAASQQADLFVEKLLTITREDGTPKYESITDALDALKASQDHIRKIETENAEYKQKVEENRILQETLNRLEEEKKLNTEKPSDKTDTNGGLSEESAAKLVEKVLVQKEAEKAAIDNIKSVQDVLIEKHGSREKAQEFVLNKSRELNMDPLDLKALSQRSPAAALALLGEAVKPTNTNLNTSTTRIPATPPSDEIKTPDVSLLSGPGATGRNQKEFVQRLREKVYKDLNVQT